MKFNLFIVILFCLFADITEAQFDNSKMSTDLYLLQQTNKNGKSTEKISILIKGNPDSISKLVKETNGIFKYAYGDIASVKIDLSTLDLFVNNPSVKRLEYKKVKAFKLFHEDSTADVNNRIGPVHAGLGNLPQAFRGAGTILGIIDDGFEWRHPDFLNPDSSSRIQCCATHLLFRTAISHLFQWRRASWSNAVKGSHGRLLSPGQIVPAQELARLPSQSVRPPDCLCHTAVGGAAREPH